LPNPFAYGSRNLFGLAVAAYLALALIFGGATHGEAFSSAIVRLAGVGLLGFALHRLTREGVPSSARWPLAILIAVALLPIAQLIPLPPGVWSGLPGRGPIADTFRQAGMALPWMPISLAPTETVDVLLSLIPAAAVFLAVITLDERARRMLTLVILAAALLGTMIGALQVASGEDSALRFYSVTNLDSAVGFFANRNHHADMLVVALPITAYWLAQSRSRSSGKDIVYLGLAAGILIILMVSLGVTKSRAGVILGVVAVLASAALLLGSKRVSKLVPIIMVAGLVVGVGLVAVFSLQGILGRFEEGLTGEARVDFWPTLVQAGKAFGPVGAGLGSFVPVFQVFERPDNLIPQFVNHAHNDYLELWIEAGWAGIALVVAGVVWVARALARSLFSPTAFKDYELPRLASIIVLILLVHSAADYPLRTAAMAAVFALACGLLAPPRALESKRRRSTMAPANDGAQLRVPALHKARPYRAHARHRP
jgi:O-antigen ligase